jgi:hypothetical protein
MCPKHLRREIFSVYRQKLALLIQLRVALAAGTAPTTAMAGASPAAL